MTLAALYAALEKHLFADDAFDLLAIDALLALQEKENDASRKA